MSSRASANKRVGILAFAFVAGMAGLAYASVPLYKLFCQVTGFGGTTQRAETAPDASSGSVMHDIRVEFDANVNGALPWSFKPMQRGVDIKMGEETLIYYEARNTSSETVTGTATFNVTPLKAGQFFNKIECFCFTEQTLKPGESVEMPVSFFIDPALAEEVNAKEIKTITLSYTFFNVES